MKGSATLFRFGVNFSYYGLTLDVSGLGLNVYQTQLLFGAVELPSKLSVFFLMRHVGRRPTQAGMLLGTALTFGISLLVFSGKPGLAVWLCPLWEFGCSLSGLCLASRGFLAPSPR